MIDRYPRYLCVTLALLAGCSSSSNDPSPAPDAPANAGAQGRAQTPDSTQSVDPIETTDPGNPAAPVSTSAGDTARYRLSFEATWSPATHPTNFPGGPHFSGLVGAVHNEQVRFWEPGQIATPGVVRVAETGAKSTLLDDAGSDSGERYAAANRPTSAPSTIARVLGAPEDSDFVDGRPDIGRFTIERLP